MKEAFRMRRLGIAFLLAVSLPFHVAAAVQLVSVLTPSVGVPAGGNGDSWAPMASADGRYVLFASTANNLARTPGGDPIPLLNPPSVNVYLRDRLDGTTTLVSVNLAGTGGGNGNSWPAGISTNGQYVLFESAASDLVANDNNNARDVFVRDLVAGVTRLVSVTPGGASGNGTSQGAVMTPDGRYVAYSSEASDLVAGDTNGIADVFVRDIQLGTTVLASPGATYSGIFGTSKDPEITSDGRYVAFYSSAIGLVSGVTTTGEIYERDLVEGTTTWASTNARTITGLSGATFCCNQAISDNGRYVAYQINSVNTYWPPGVTTNGYILRFDGQTGLTELIDTNAALPLGIYGDIRSLDMTPDGRFITFVANSNTATRVFLWDSETGTNTLVSANLSGGVTAGSSTFSPDVDPTGRYVVFYSSATDLTTNGTSGLFERDMQAGTTALVSVGTNGLSLPVSSAAVPAMSADGGYVAFESAGANLDGLNLYYDVFGRDVDGGATELISAHEPDLPSVTPNGPSVVGSGSVSTNGRYVAYASWANNLAAGDTNRCPDVFVRDLVAGTNVLVSVNTNGDAGDGISTDPSISGDGRYVAFASCADDLVPGDMNQAWDIFVRDLPAATNDVVSVGTNGGFGNGDCDSPVISADGRYVLFCSQAQNLAPGIYTGDNLFLRDRQMRQTYALTTGSYRSYAMTRDGHFVAYVGTLGSGTNLYVWDSETASRIYTNASVSITNVAISADGRWLAYVMGTTLWAADLVAGTNCLVAPGYFGPRAGLQFSDDGRFLVYATSFPEVTGDTNGASDVYLYDFQSGTNLLVSRSFDQPGAADGASDTPTISPDGRFVAYRSFADDCVPGDVNGVPDVFVYDRESGATILLSVNEAGNATGGNRSLTPVFSADGKTLVFASWAADLAAQDFNTGSDLFALDLSAFAAGTNPTNPPPVGQAEIVFERASGSGGLGPIQGPEIAWSFVPGGSYAVQFKDSLSDPDWQPLDGSLTVVGNRAYITDLAPPAGQRFYRVELLNN